MLPCYLYQRDPTHLNVRWVRRNLAEAEIETHQTIKHFFNLLLSNFGNPMQKAASDSCSNLKEVAFSVVFCFKVSQVEHSVLVLCKCFLSNILTHLYSDGCTVDQFGVRTLPKDIWPADWSISRRPALPPELQTPLSA